MVCAGRTTAELVASIEAAQNADGGWGYNGRSSWTEPTAFALLALSTTAHTTASFRRGITWLQSVERPDGGWAPHPSVAQSSWVTALAILALTETSPPQDLSGALAWLNRQTGEESTWADRLRRLLLGARMEAGEGTTGWPWFPGTAGWVMPTALSILALEKAAQRGFPGGSPQRLRDGRQFLLARICEDGGWNYGGTKALGFSAESYPDTTGMALLALHGMRNAEVQAAVAKGEARLPGCRSAQTVCWLRLGLAAHGKHPPGSEDCHLEGANLLDRTLMVLARAPEEGGRRVWGAV